MSDADVELSGVMCTEPASLLRGIRALLVSEVFQSSIASPKDTVCGPRGGDIDDGARDITLFASFTIRRVAGSSSSSSDEVSEWSPDSVCAFVDDDLSAKEGNLDSNSCLSTS